MMNPEEIIPGVVVESPPRMKKHGEPTGVIIDWRWPDDRSQVIVRFGQMHSYCYLTELNVLK